MNTSNPSGRGVMSRRDEGLGEVVSVMFLAGVVLAFVLVLTLAGRGAETRLRIDHAAESAAQAAARQRTPTAAVDAAANIINTNLSGVCTGGPDIDVDTSRWAPGGIVAVTIACRVRTSDLAPLPLPGTLTARASGAAIIDVHRFNGTAP